MTTQINKSEIFKAAHKSTRFFFKAKMNKKYNYVAMFSFFLKRAYSNAKAKAATIITNIIKKSDKAILALVNVTFEKRTINNVTFEKEIKKITQKIEIWIPKSQIENGIVSKWFLSQNNYISITNA